MQRTDFRAMGCAMAAIVDSDAPAAATGVARVPAWFAHWERCLSRFHEDSELSQLNRSAGRPIRVSDVLWEVLAAAHQAAHWTEGLVTPTLLDALVAAGYDRPFPLLNISARPVCPAPRASPTDCKDILLDAEVRTVTLRPGVRLDLGGIAKGWAADRAARRLAMYGPALVDAGGDLAISGPRADGTSWPVGVSDPHHPDRPLVVLGLTGGGVATSGRDFRRWARDGVWLHHIIDPRTGRPASTDVLSATVIAPNPLLAEVAAKAVLIQGSDAGLAWIEAHPPLAGLLVLDDGRILTSRLLEAYCWR